MDVRATKRHRGDGRFTIRGDTILIDGCFETSATIRKNAVSACKYTNRPRFKCFRKNGHLQI
uniref:Ribosomal protein L16 n=1 Tax=Romanomermis culicivorax TaxID=13658 RepID=A0A915HXK1_ROMCU